MTLVERYLELGLRIGRHIDGFVDAYYGPAELSARVEAEAPVDPSRLQEAAASLHAELDGGEAFDGQRARWLRGQLAALECVARRLGGEQLGYADEVEACYGVRPRWTPEETFETAHRLLDGALPGGTPLADRLQTWLDTHNVPPDRLGAALAALNDDARDRTARLLGLPEGEEVELELVRDEPWAAFNYYRGDLRSRVVVNTDLPVRASTLVTLVTHECYPGHHTEHATKEALLVRDRGQLEETILLVSTPQSLVGEGIAEIAAEVLLGDDEEQVALEHLGALGIDYDAAVAGVVRRTGELLRPVGTNAALLLHERGATAAEVREYLARWALHSPQRSEKALEFLTDPTWRSYTACYSEGGRLARGFVGGDVERFRRLLTEQLVPDDLAA